MSRHNRSLLSSKDIKAAVFSNLFICFEISRLLLCTFFARDAKLKLVIILLRIAQLSFVFLNLLQDDSVEF